MQLEDVQNHLKALSGGGLVLTTEQLARCLSMNPKVISRMRQEQRFPIPHKTIGTRKVVYSITAVAIYLTSDDEAPTQGGEPAKARSSKPRHEAAAKQAILPDLSKHMLMRGFLNAVKAQHDALSALMIQVERKVDYEELQADLKKTFKGAAKQAIIKV